MLQFWHFCLCVFNLDLIEHIILKWTMKTKSVRDKLQILQISTSLT